MDPVVSVDMTDEDLLRVSKLYSLYSEEDIYRDSA